MTATAGPGTAETTAVQTGAHLSARVLGMEVLDELRGILREPTALFFSVLMPVGFFALFASMFGGGQEPSGLPVAASMLATYGTFGVVAVVLLNPGIGVAEDRARGWLRVKKVSPVPIGTTLVAKVIATVPYAVAVLVAMTAVLFAVAGPAIDAVAWLRLVAVLLLGALPFALLGLAVGFVASSNAAVAILNAVFFPMAVASGLWFPLELMPAFIQDLAPFLPTYHLAQLALAQLTGAGGGLVHVLALALTAVVGGGLAAAAYRNLRV